MLTQENPIAGTNILDTKNPIEGKVLMGHENPITGEIIGHKKPVVEKTKKKKKHSKGKILAPNNPLKGKL